MSADLPIQMFPMLRGVKKGTPSPKKGKGLRGTPVLIRLPQDVIEHMDAAASAQFRSRSGEIRFRLEASMANESIDEHGVIVVQAQRLAK